MTSRGMRTFLFLILVYFSQVNPFYHVHHFHDDGLMEFEISSHPVDVNVEHPSDHTHDEQDKPHSNDHQHTYDNQIDWHIVRTQLQKTNSDDNRYIFCANLIILTDNTGTSYYDILKPPLIDSYKTSSLIIRGPPLFA